MALKVLLLRNKLDSRKKKLDELREKEQEFEKREAELEAAIEEMTEETPEEEQDVVEQQAEQFQTEKDTYEKEKKDLETEIAGIEEEIRTEEEKQPKPEKKEKREKGEGKMETRRMEHGVFFGMNMQERDAMMAREDVKGFMEQVRECIKNKRALTNVGLTIPDDQPEPHRHHFQCDGAARLRQEQQAHLVYPAPLCPAGLHCPGRGRGPAAHQPDRDHPLWKVL